MYWGGKGQDVDAIFREYCRLFFGPAENEMRTFYEYCEANWQEIENDKAMADTALALFATAQKKVAAESVEAKRIALVDDYLNGLRNKSKQLGQKRGQVPSLRIVSDTRGLVLDGKLDEQYWQECPGSATCRLRELQTGRAPIFGTSVKAGWENGNLWLAIRCEEPRGSKPNITSTKKDDGAMWYGDVVEILLETESHSYYQVAINPAGIVADLDRSAPKTEWFTWDSQAEVITHIADDHWTAEVRIPVTEDDNDPLHQVIGRKPTASLPWHVNICRQRIRDNGAEHSAFSPTGTDNFHRELKFAHFYLGRSHEFEAAEPPPDFLTSFHAASELDSKGKHEEAVAAFTALADTKITDLQKSTALEQAAASASDLRKPDLAAEVAARIPIPAVRKVAQMENLLAARQAPQLIEQFGTDDIPSWPFWKMADGYSARGRAYAEVGDGARAEADLLKALELATDEVGRAQLWLAMGQNREKNLKNPAQALAAYREIAEMKKGTGTATFFRGVQLAAQLLNQDGKHDEAEAVLRKVNFDNLRGNWRGTLSLALAETQLAAGRTKDALAAYQSIAADEAVQADQPQIAQDAIKALEK
jgi:tetratricopeptide (TPR) repeat protein